MRNDQQALFSFSFFSFLVEKMNLHQIKRFVLLLLFLPYMVITLAYSEGIKADKPEKDLDYVLSRIEEAQRALTTLMADMTIIRTIALLESEEVSTGSLIYQKPRMLHIRFAPPRNEINLIDGKNIWIYHLDSKQAERYEIDHGDGESQTNAFFNLGFDGSMEVIKEKYNISLIDYPGSSGEGGGKILYRLNLTAKDGKSGLPYSNIQLWIQDGLWLPVIFDLYESGGEIINHIELKNVEINRHVPDKIFKFNIPEDVEVIEPLR